MSDETRDGNVPHDSDVISTPISRGTLLRGAAGVGAGLLGAGLLPASAMQSPDTPYHAWTCCAAGFQSRR